MDSESTTPTRGSCTTGSSQSCSPDPPGTRTGEGGVGNQKTIMMDDFEVKGEVVYSRDGVIVQAKKRRQTSLRKT